MEEQSNTLETEKKTEPASIGSPQINSRAPQHNLWRLVGTVVFCFVAGFLGAWTFAAVGVIPKSDNSTGSNQQIVLKEEELVAEVAKKVNPSVVSIVTNIAPRSAFDTGGQGAGTGIIVSDSGYIMTNRHVVPSGASSVKITLSDGTEYDDVDIIGRDPLNDIAFLKINNPGKLSPAKIGDSSSMSVGQKVVAIGNALGEYHNTVTSGIISGIGRPLVAQSGDESEQLSSLFQTDAAINPGNSGGPLLNLNGEVIGINTAIAQSAEGIGFAIPINAAKGVLKGVLETGKLERAYLGVQYVDVTPAVIKDQKLPDNALNGALISDNGVVSDGPADKAGLKSGDVILKVNNRALSQADSLSLVVSEYRPGDKVTLTILRGDKEQTIEVTLQTFKN